MNSDTIKGTLQKIGGRIEESAGVLSGDENLKIAGQQDQLKGGAREAWGNVKDAGNALIDRARAAKLDAEVKSERAAAFDREHAVSVSIPDPKAEAKEKEEVKADKQQSSEPAAH